jgi:hypothetical protein
MRPSASYIVFCVPSLCVPSVSTGNLATSPVPGTVSQDLMRGEGRYQAGEQGPEGATTTRGGY